MEELNFNMNTEIPAVRPTREEIHYIDADGRPTQDVDQAERFFILEYDEDGNLISESVGVMKR